MYQIQWVLKGWTMVHDGWIKFVVIEIITPSFEKSTIEY